MAKYVKTEQGYQEIKEVNFNKMDANNPVGTGSFSMGRKFGTVVGTNSHAEGFNTTASGERSHAEGASTTASGNGSHAEGASTTAKGEFSHAEGNTTTASSNCSHAEGFNTTASGNCSHAEGGVTKATSSNDTVSTTSIATNGYYTHAEGYGTVAYGRCSHAEGNGTKSSGNDSHAEGYRTKSSGNDSHAEGYRTTASGNYSHAEGSDTDASGKCSHAEGGGTKASGIYSHAEGWGTIATGANSHTEGDHTTASGYASHAEGRYTKASGENSHAEGKYNIEDTANKYAHIVGNGTSTTARSNAHTLDWNGIGWFKDSVKVGGSSQDDSAAKTLATTDYVDTTVSTKISGKQDTLIQSGASVGQIAKITAVDSSGKPTAWEAVDMPSGGGGSGWREVIDYTVDAETSALTITTDKNGLPFNLREAVLFIEAVGNAETETFRFVVSTDQAVDVSWGSGTELFVVPGLASKMERQYYLARFIALVSATLPVTAMKTSTSNYVDVFMPDRVSNGDSAGFNGKNAGNYTKIDQLKFVSYARILNAGARVRLWGVDA